MRRPDEPRLARGVDRLTTWPQHQSSPDQGEMLKIDKPAPVIAHYQQRNKQRAEAAKAAAATATAAPIAESAAASAEGLTTPPVDPMVTPTSAHTSEETSQPVAEDAAVAAAASAAAATLLPHAAEPATEPNVVVPRSEVSAADHPAPAPYPAAASILGAWVQDDSGRVMRMSETARHRTLHIRASFPDAGAEPAFGVLVTGRTGEPVLVEHTLRRDLLPGAPPHHPETPYTVRFHVHAGTSLYVASVAVHAPEDARERTDSREAALAFVVFGTHQLHAGRAPVPEHLSGSGPPPRGARVAAVGDAWLQEGSGKRERGFQQRNGATLRARLTLPGDRRISLDSTPIPTAPAHSDYTIKLYAYTEVGHYSASIALTHPVSQEHDRSPRCVAELCD